MNFSEIDGATLRESENTVSDKPREGEPTVMSYERNDTTIRFKLKNASNHEIRELLVGIWAKLDKEDREDHINELVQYHPLLVKPDRHPDVYLSDISACLCNRPELGRSRRLGKSKT